ncbi:DUF4133 domain-containing protein [Chitinophaga defluvii]|uniref:DUF4133 domain-containing protein n=1 Tax=Chitinophaga defluvii TaxID=3163343 RepID=A0ABV2T8Q8_9BACT
MSSVYEINKGINKPIEFKGLKAQYITYLAVGLVFLLVLFAVGYMAGVPVIVVLLVIGLSGFGLVSWMYKLSHKYGTHGLMKKAAYRQVPSAIICRSRKVFLEGLVKEVYGNSEHNRPDVSGSGNSIAAKKQSEK